MKVLFVYRHPDMGFSIGKVFKPIESELMKYAEIESLTLPIPNYGIKGLWTNVMFLRKCLARVKYDVVFITGTENYLLPFIRPTKSLVVVHDVKSLINNVSGLKLKIKELLFIRVLKLADKIVSISRQTQKELLLYGIKSDVVYNPVSPSFSYKEKETNKVCPRILHIGTKPNKNLKNTILALKDFSCHLRIVGKLKDGDIQLLQDNSIDYSSCSNISDEELLQEYQKCDILNFPSLYEGFGMPIIEGQAIGRVVVTSNISPMKDVAGGAAVLVNPNDSLSIRNGYGEALANSNNYIEKGLKNVRRFSVGNIAKQYYNILNNLV